VVFSAHGFCRWFFLFPVKELGFWTNPGHWVRVLNIIYVGFPGLGFQGKNLCVMFVFAIVSFLFFSEYLFTVDIVQG
jgi:hypothetical protein